MVQYFLKRYCRLRKQVWCRLLESINQYFSSIKWFSPHFYIYFAIMFAYLAGLFLAILVCGAVPYPTTFTVETFAVGKSCISLKSIVLRFFVFENDPEVITIFVWYNTFWNDISTSFLEGVDVITSFLEGAALFSSILKNKMAFISFLNSFHNVC